jgi:hypothetical protein
MTAAAASAAPGRKARPVTGTVEVSRAWLLDLCEAGAVVFGKLLVERAGGAHMRTPHCQIGQWLRPDSARQGGEPCSALCQAVKRALVLASEGAEIVERSSVRQLSLTERKGA